MEGDGRNIKQEAAKETATELVKLVDEVELGSVLGLAVGGGDESNSASALKNPSTSAQLTIFYNGTVNVYDAVSPEKAQAIMFIAAAAAAAATAAAGSSGNNKGMTRAPSKAGPNIAIIASPALTRSLSQQSSSTTPSPQPPHLLTNPSPYLCKMQTEIPAARRHSLQRFLEKRRDRFVSRAPYVSEKSFDGGMEVGIDAKPGVD